MNGDLIVDGLGYPIVVARDAAATLPRFVADHPRVAIVHDARVAGRAHAIGAALGTAGVEVLAAVPLDAGERAKSIATLERIYYALLEARADRRTLVVAVGGGTVTDVTGFAAATFMRGMPWAAVPTTVLGMADAAIGGKTAVDLPQGKNLVGAFWDPVAVVGDLEALESLPPEERATGAAEIVKCGVIGGEPLMGWADALDAGAPPAGWRAAIAGAARVKVGLVAADPREHGPRASLNLGHTIGHALEHATEYAMPHGAAVAVGMRAAGLMARRMGLWSGADHRRVLACLRALGLPLWRAGVAPDAVLAAAARDKKAVGGRMRFVLPIRIGEVRHGVDVEPTVVREAVVAVGAPPLADEMDA